MPRSNSRIPYVRTTCWSSNAVIVTFASRQIPKPLHAWSSSVTDAAKSLAGRRGLRPSLEYHTFTWLTFDESGKPLPEAALSQILLDQQSLGGDLKDLPITHIRGLLSSVPRLTDDFVVGCDELTSMQGQQLCQQPQGRVCLALSRDPRAAGNACLGVPVGIPLSLPLVGPATLSSAPLQAVRTLSP